MTHPLMLVAIAISAATGAPSVAPASTVPASPAQEFAKCAVRHYEGAELLATRPASPEEADILSEFGLRSCAVPSQPHNLLRGAIAEQLFETDFGAIGARSKRALIEVFTVNVAEFDDLDPGGKRQLELLGFGTCVAAADPIKSVSLLGTVPGSPEEAKLVAELLPKFSACLSQGDLLNFEKSELRGALAEGAYRLALADSLDGEIVVTGTKDPSRSVVCKMQEASAGSRFRHKTCLTAAQWKFRDSENKYASDNMARRVREHEERRTTCITRANFSEISCKME